MPLIIESISEEAARRLAFLAALIAIEAPEHRARYSVDAKVSWDLIAQLRETLAKAGFPMAEFRKQYDLAKRRSLRLDEEEA